MTFIVVYSAVTYFFALKMSRLLLLMGPVSAINCGVALGYAADLILNNGVGILCSLGSLISWVYSKIVYVEKWAQHDDVLVDNRKAAILKVLGKGLYDVVYENE